MAEVLGRIFLCYVWIIAEVGILAPNAIRMKAPLLLMTLSILGFQSVAQTSYTKLPKTWEKDFTITLSFGGSMDGSNTDLRYTYDSCIYLRNTGMKPAKKDVYLLTEADRIEILKRLRDMKVDKISSEISISAVDDGWSTSICFGSHCVEGGTSAKISEHDKEVFSTAYGYLEEFAMIKTSR